MVARIVFMGSPEFALPVLERLASAYSLVGVVTQPDKPAGRGQTLTSPPVKQMAEKMGLPVIQPRRLREPEAMQQLRDWSPDVIVVAAFGQILRAEVLEMPPYGCINVHASLLPRWRGAAPIQAAILNGDSQTGVTIMKMDAGVDTGDMLAQRAVPITGDDTAGRLTTTLSLVGADLLAETLPAYLRGEITPVPQDASLATKAPMLAKEDGLLDFEQPASKLALKVRAFNPRPGAYLLFDGQVFKVHRARALPGSGDAGTRLAVDGLPAVATADGLLVLDEVQPAGKKSMAGEVFLRGSRTWLASGQ